MSSKISFLVICESLGLFVNTLTCHSKYSHRNRENLPQPIQTQFSKKQKTVTQLLVSFLNCWTNFEIFEKKMTFISYYFRHYGLWKTWFDKWLDKNVLNSLEISKTALLSYFSITLTEIELENISLSDT